MKNVEVINFNRKRKLLLFFINISFVVSGIFLIIISINFRPFWIINSAWIVRVVGLVGALYFGMMLISNLKVLYRTVALIIDNDGIVDQSSSIGVGRILWSQVRDVKTYDAGAVSYVLIYVDEPEAFIKRNRNFFERWHLKINFNMYRTPIAIPLIWMHIYIDDLNSLLQDRFELFKKQSNLHQ